MYSDFVEAIKYDLEIAVILQSLCGRCNWGALNTWSCAHQLKPVTAILYSVAVLTTGLPH